MDKEYSQLELDELWDEHRTLEMALIGEYDPDNHAPILIRLQELEKIFYEEYQKKDK